MEECQSFQCRDTDSANAYQNCPRYRELAGTPDDSEMVIGFGSRVNPGCKVEVMENGGIKKKIMYSVSAATGTNTENLLICRTTVDPPEQFTTSTFMAPEGQTCIQAGMLDITDRAKCENVKRLSRMHRTIDTLHGHTR